MLVAQKNGFQICFSGKKSHVYIYLFLFNLILVKEVKTVITEDIYESGRFFHIRALDPFSDFPFLAPILVLGESFAVKLSYEQTSSLFFFGNYWPHSMAYGLPWWLHSKESACNAGATGDVGSILGLGRFPRGGNVPHSSILAWEIPWTECYSSWDHKEMDTEEMEETSEEMEHSCLPWHIGP